MLMALALPLLLAFGAAAQQMGKAPFQSPAVSAGRVDLNTATPAELNLLPGIGPATTKKIIAGRPYSSVQDLGRAGVSQRQIDQISPLVTIGGAPSLGGANRIAPNLAPPGSPAVSSAPAPGMVWVNTDTKVFHREGDRWYGHTKHGKFMTESDAVAAGYHAAKKK
jgi:hypothetical protein